MEQIEYITIKNASNKVLKTNQGDRNFYTQYIPSGIVIYGMQGGVVVLKTYCGPEVFNKKIMVHGSWLRVQG